MERDGDVVATFPGGGAGSWAGACRFLGSVAWVPPAGFSSLSQISGALNIGDATRLPARLRAATAPAGSSQGCYRSQGDQGRIDGHCRLRRNCSAWASEQAKCDLAVLVASTVAGSRRVVERVQPFMLRAFEAGMSRCRPQHARRTAFFGRHQASSALAHQRLPGASGRQARRRRPGCPCAGVGGLGERAVRSTGGWAGPSATQPLACAPKRQRCPRSARPPLHGASAAAGGSRITGLVTPGDHEPLRAQRGVHPRPARHPLYLQRDADRHPRRPASMQRPRVGAPPSRPRPAVGERHARRGVSAPACASAVQHSKPP